MHFKNKFLNIGYSKRKNKNISCMEEDPIIGSERYRQISTFIIVQTRFLFFQRRAVRKNMFQDV